MRTATASVLILTLLFTGCSEEEGTTVPGVTDSGVDSSPGDVTVDSNKPDTAAETTPPKDDGVETTPDVLADSDAAADAPPDAPTDGDAVADVTDSGSEVLPDVVADVPEVILDGSTGCHLVINELQTGSGTIDGGSGATNEFVEIFNPCTSAISVGGYTVVYRSATGTSDVVMYTFGTPDGGTAPSIAAGGYFVIGNTAYSGPRDGDMASGGMAAAGGGVGLRDGTAALVDSVGYGTATNAFIETTVAAAPGDTSPAKSLARIPSGTDTGDNSKDFKVSTTPTPKAVNVP